MEVIPAIDLIDGKCVRLVQGDYSQQLTYEADPIEQARKFLAAGARSLHIVDLDGARLGKPVNIDTIESITAAVELKIEIGGGIRDEESIRVMLDLGVSRVIIGTSAVSKPDWFGQMADKFPQQLVLGLDARGSDIASHGWIEQGCEQLLEFAAQAANLPLAAIIYTDISKDGMMAGPNFERTKADKKSVCKKNNIRKIDKTNI